MYGICSGLLISISKKQRQLFYGQYTGQPVLANRAT